MSILGKNEVFLEHGCYINLRDINAVQHRFLEKRDQIVDIYFCHNLTPKVTLYGEAAAPFIAQLKEYIKECPESYYVGTESFTTLYICVDGIRYILNYDIGFTAGPPLSGTTFVGHYKAIQALFLKNR